MRHHNKVKKFGRKRNQRTALMRTLAHSLLRDGRIQTTVVKAKALRPFVERLITKARTDTLASRKLAIERLGGSSAMAKLYKDIAPTYAGRAGGYTRVVKTGFRKSDGAPMAIIELV